MRGRDFVLVQQISGTACARICDLVPLTLRVPDSSTGAKYGLRPEWLVGKQREKDKCLTDEIRPIPLPPASGAGLACRSAGDVMIAKVDGNG